MQSTAHVQKPTASNRTVCDPIFTPTFYRPYEAAARIALTLLCDVRRQMQREHGENSVCALTYRLKSPASIRGKLIKKGLPVCAIAASAALRDVAGLRAVLSNEESVYRFARLLCDMVHGEVIATHDYIASPKPSGYRSLHVLLRIPVSIAAQAYAVPVEIQLRTASMDVWASIDHEICYKPTQHTE